MRAAIVVGLSGNIGSGKSEARRFWQSLGVPCLDADAVARELLDDADHVATEELRNAFPAYLSQGELQRGTLRELITQQPGANERVLTILKPHVLAVMQRWTEMQTSPYVIWESALIPAVSVTVNHSVVVTAEHTLRRNRIQARNRTWTAEQIDGIMSLQATMPMPEVADVVENNETLVQLQEKIENLHANYLRKWGAI